MVIAAYNNAVAFGKERCFWCTFLCNTQSALLKILMMLGLGLCCASVISSKKAVRIQKEVCIAKWSAVRR